MKSKTSLALFVVLNTENELFLLQDENNELPSVDLIDADGNLLHSPAEGLYNLVCKYFRLDYDYVMSQVSQLFIDCDHETNLRLDTDHTCATTTIYHKIVLIKSSNFFNDVVNYIPLKDKLADVNYYKLCKQFRLTQLGQ